MRGFCFDKCLATAEDLRRDFQKRFPEIDDDTLIQKHQ